MPDKEKPRKRILLVYVSRYSSGKLSMPVYQLSSYPQLGLLYLASVLRNEGFQPEYLDPVSTPLNRSAFLKAISRDDVLFVGFYSNFALKEAVCRFIGIVKDIKNIPVLVGGPGFYDAGSYFNAGADAVVAGEADDIIGSIARRIEAGRSLRGIAGVTLPEIFPLTLSAPVFPNSDINDLPRPDWRQSDPRNCFCPTMVFGRHPFATVMASRGCPMACAFCWMANRKWKTPWRIRSAEDVVMEIVELHRRFGVRHISFQDDCFGARLSWVDDLCERLLQSSLDITWDCYGHPLVFSKMNNNFLKKIRKSGCRSVHFGLQSASPSVLKKINRSPDEADILIRLFPLMKKLGYYLILDFIYGLPGDTRQSLAANFNYALKAGPHRISIAPLLVFPGTGLYEVYKENPPSSVSNEEIRNAIVQGMKRYHLRPGIVFENVRFALKYNPDFIIRLLASAPGWFGYFARLNEFYKSIDE